jgi:hypothetical protein
MNSTVGSTESAANPQNLKSNKLAVAAVALAFILYSARMFLLISRYAVNIFFSDQWDFNDATLFQKHSLWKMFSWQHGPHRQGLGALFGKAVEPAFAWNSRTEAFVVGGVICVAGICALYLKRKLYGSLSFFDIAIVALIFTPAQWETLFGVANFAHGPFPLLLLLVYCLSWTLRKRTLRYPLVLILNFVTIYTGFGLFLGVLTPALLAFDYWSGAPGNRLPRSYFVTTLVIALLSLGSFFLGYRFNPAVDCFTFQPMRFRVYAAFVDLMFAGLSSIKGTHGIYLVLGGIFLAAALITLAVAVRQLLRRQTGEMAESGSTAQLVILAMTAYSVLFCLNTAYGRQCGGLLPALSSRYAIYVEPAMLGLYFQFLNVRQQYVRKSLLFGFLLAVVVASSRADRREMEHFRSIKQTWKACYLQTEDIQHCNEIVGYPIYPYPPERTHLQEKLQYLKRTRQNLYADSRQIGELEAAPLLHWRGRLGER